MSIDNYPNELIIMHLQAQIIRILDGHLGYVASNSEYRGLGKSRSIQHIVSREVKEGYGNNVMIVYKNQYHKDLQSRTLRDVMPSMYDIIKDRMFGFDEMFRLIIKGSGIDNMYKIHTIYLDGVDRNDYLYLERRLRDSGIDVKIVGFINL